MRFLGGVASLLFFSIAASATIVLPGIDSDLAKKLSSDNLVTCERVRYDPDNNRHGAQVKVTLRSKGADIPVVIVRYSDIENLVDFPLATSDLLSQDPLFSNGAGAFQIKLKDHSVPTEYTNALLEYTGQLAVLDVTSSGTYCVYTAPQEVPGLDLDVEFRNSHGYLTYEQYVRFFGDQATLLVLLVSSLVVYQYLPASFDPPKTYFLISSAVLIVAQLTKVVDLWLVLNHDVSSYDPTAKILHELVGSVSSLVSLLFAMGLWNIHGSRMTSLPATSKNIALVLSAVSAIVAYYWTAVLQDGEVLESGILDLDETMQSAAILCGLLVSILPFIKAIFTIRFHLQTKREVINTPLDWMSGTIGFTLLYETVAPWLVFLYRLYQDSVPDIVDLPDLFEHLSSVSQADSVYFKLCSVWHEIAVAFVFQAIRLYAFYYIWSGTPMSLSRPQKKRE